MLCAVSLASCKESPPDSNDKGNKNGAVYADNLARQNLLRAMQVCDSAVRYYFTGTGMTMSRYYNPYTRQRDSETGSIWMYTASIEAVNAVMHGLLALKEKGTSDLYDQHFERYKTLLKKLVENADFYQGTFTLTSYTQTREWSVYAVNRASGKGGASVACKDNVYDDQMWFIRELIEAYRLTDDGEYLDKAEYLTAYVLDGWYRTLASDGGEAGGIPWGPGYVSKHTCSNGPVISPLVWLYEIYRDKADNITCTAIDADGGRIETTQAKKDYYLNAATMLYQWMKTHLLRSDGLYHDATWGADGACASSGGCCDGACCIPYETISGERYRRPSPCNRPGGNPLSYNMGSPLSGAADLYRVTQNAGYLADAKALADRSFAYFATPSAKCEGCCTYAIDGFNNWFNGVLMRSYIDVYPHYNDAAKYIGSFQNNLDYGYENYLYDGFLPHNLLVGWSKSGNASNRVEGMFMFAFAAEYAALAKYELSK
jgi:hypothetical protein